MKSIHSNLRCIDQEQFLGEFFPPSSRLTELWGRRERGGGEEKEIVEYQVEMGIEMKGNLVRKLCIGNQQVKEIKSFGKCKGLAEQ